MSRRSRSRATLPRPATTAAGKETCPSRHASPTSPAANPWSIAMPAYVLRRLQTAPTSPSPVATPASTPASGPPTSPARMTVGRFEAEDDARSEHDREEPVGRADRREDDERPQRERTVQSPRLRAMPPPPRSRGRESRPRRVFRRAGRRSWASTTSHRPPPAAGEVSSRSQRAARPDRQISPRRGSRSRIRWSAVRS